MFSPDLLLCLLSARPKMLAEIYGRLNTVGGKGHYGREAVVNSVIDYLERPGQLTPPLLNTAEAYRKYRK